MSGGRFDYVDSQLKSEIFGWSNEYKDAPNVFEDVEINELVWDTLDLIHDYDWYTSGDTSKQRWLESKSVFKQKWLKTDVDRVKRIIDAEIEKCKVTLYETYMPNGKEE